MKGRTALSELRELIGDGGFASYRPITEAHRQVCLSGPHSWLRREIINPAAIKAGSDETILDVGSWAKVESLWVTAADSTERRWSQIDETTPSTFEEEVVRYRESDGDEELGRPQFFKWEGNRIRWLPTPESDFDLKLQVVLAPGDIRADTDLLVPEEYSFVVVYFAAAWVLALSPEPTKQQQAMVHKNNGEMALKRLTANTVPNRLAHWDKPRAPVLR